MEVNHTKTDQLKAYDLILGGVKEVLIVFYLNNYICFKNFRHKKFNGGQAKNIYSTKHLNTD